MRKLILLSMLITVIGQSCRKENSAAADPRNLTQASLEIDGEIVSVTYKGDQINECETYTFVGNAGYYHGLGSHFDMGDNQDLQIIFGTLRTDSSSLSETAFLKLIRQGERDFGSLGAFSSYPKIDSGKVEIAFTDKKSVKWCSSEITEKSANYGIETTVNVNQPEGKFVIEEIERVTVNDAYAFRIKGTFTCRMYEVNGKKKKNMKGGFVGIMKMN